MLVGAFNQEKARVQSRCLLIDYEKFSDGSFAALVYCAHLAVGVVGQLKPSRQEEVGSQLDRVGVLRTLLLSLQLSLLHYHYYNYLLHLPQVDEVVGCPAVAGDGEVAGLGVQGEERQVHRAAQGQGHLDK